MGYRWARTAAEVVEAAERAEHRLEAEYGSVQEFTPPAGPVAADRVEAFLAVRELMAPQRTALKESVEALAPSDGEGRTVGGLRAARAGIGMAPRILEFARARNEALLEIEIGPGEYAWMYWLTYHAWLGHPVGESLLNDIMEARSELDDSFQMHIDGMDTDHAARQLRRDVRAMLRNLEDELSVDPDRAELSELVAAELAAIDADPSRIPWENGLPEAFAVGLDPYRDRLETSYSPATNPFELLELDSGPHGITLEQGSRGAGEQGSRGAGEQGSRGPTPYHRLPFSLSPFLPFSPAPFLPCPLSPRRPCSDLCDKTNPDAVSG
jgi:hypothetical protein